jgi:hypothetical protein
MRTTDPETLRVPPPYKKLSSRTDVSHAITATLQLSYLHTVDVEQPPQRRRHRERLRL